MNNNNSSGGGVGSFYNNFVILLIVNQCSAIVAECVHSLFAYLKAMVLSYVSYSMSIPDRNVSYFAVETYISKHIEQFNSNISTCDIKRANDDTKNTRGVVYLIPQGFSTFLYKNSCIRINLARNGRTGNWDGCDLTLTVYGLNIYRLKSQLHEFLVECAEEYEKNTNGFTKLFRADALGDGRWQLAAQIKGRSLNTVVLNKESHDQIIHDMQQFLSPSTKQFYTNLGIKHQRGYLLHGPPGCGKSSYVAALAHHFGLSLCILSLSSESLSDDKIAKIMDSTPTRSIVVIEDVDAAFTETRKKQQDTVKGNNLTFSGLLNALDGISSTPERILIMTTNHIDNLDEALIRAGRVDKKFLFDLFGKEEARRMFELFFMMTATTEKSIIETDKQLLTDRSLEFSQRITAPISGAILQNYLFERRLNMQCAIDEIDKLYVMQEEEKQRRLRKQQQKQLEEDAAAAAAKIEEEKEEETTSTTVQKKPINKNTYTNQEPISKEETARILKEVQRRDVIID